MKMKFSWKMLLIVVAIVLALALLFVFAFQGVQNKAIGLEEQITTAQSEIKVQEKRRADLIPNLVDCVKDYNEHEYNTLMAIVEARGSNSVDVANEVKTAINVIAEQYPELRSNENYKQLMTELSTTENLIANTRSNYNNWVSQYNSHVRKFPNRSILNMLGYEVQPFEKLIFNTSSDAPTNLFD
jgi:LemA protein